MKRKILSILFILMLVGGFLGVRTAITRFNSNTGAPPYNIDDAPPPDLDPYAWIRDWKRPEVPARVGLQVGHWKNNELPEELERLRGNTGATGGGKTEWEVNLAIAEQTKTLLEAEGVLVDILPSTIPVDYWADAFVAIHADGNLSSAVSGYKAAAPRRDTTGKAGQLRDMIETAYEAETKLAKDPNVSRNMTGYYAFAWWRYDHAVHPMTTSIILETGFLSSPSDRRIIVNNQARAARGLADGIIAYLKAEQLLG